MNKEVKQLLKLVKKQGGTWEKKGRHIRVYGKAGVKPFVLLPSTPSDWRALKNARAQLKRTHGYKV